MRLLYSHSYTSSLFTLQALRLLDRQLDVCIFLGMEHCRSNNIKLAMDFMRVGSIDLDLGLVNFEGRYCLLSS